MDKILDIVRTVAPSLASAFGGPLAGLAARTISDVLLGKPNATEEELQEAIAKATPEQLLALKKAEYEFSQKMKELEIDLERIASDDRASARNREIKTRDWTPRILVFIVTTAWACMMYLLFSDVVPSSNRELLARGMGTMDTLLVMAWTYFFGSSAGSRAKDETMNKLVQR